MQVNEHFEKQNSKIVLGLTICIGVHLDSYLIVTFKCHYFKIFPRSVLLLRVVGAAHAVLWSPSIASPTTKSDAIIFSHQKPDKLTFEAYSGSNQDVARLTALEKLSGPFNSSTLVRVRPHHRWVWKVSVILSCLIVLTSLPLTLIVATQDMQVEKDLPPETYDWYISFQDALLLSSLGFSYS